MLADRPNCPRQIYGPTPRARANFVAMEPKSASMLLVQNALVRWKEFLEESRAQMQKSLAEIKQDLQRDLHAPSADDKLQKP